MKRAGGFVRPTGAAARADAKEDKFIGLVEKHTVHQSADSSSSSGIDQSIRSSSLNAPFGSQSTAAAQRNANPFGVKASGNKTLDRIFVQARRTGVLTMDNMSLNEFPPQVCSLYDESSITADEKFWECVDLTSLSMQHNSLTSIPEQISNLMHLQLVLLSHNKISSLPAAIFQIESIKKLDFSHNQLREFGEQYDLRGLINLVELNLSNNQLKSLPEAIVDLPTLQVLHVSHNFLESLPQHIGDLRDLRRLHASQNKLVAIPPSFSNLTKLTLIELKQNRIGARASSGPPGSRNAGPIPSLKFMKDLVSIDLSENQLEVLPEFPSSSVLTTVSAAFNVLTSLEPLMVIKGLATLDVHNNRLETLPRNICVSCTQLRHCDLSNNELGDISGELGLLSKLNKLLIDGNPLRKFPRGKLPTAGGSIEAFKKYLITRIDAAQLKEFTNQLSGGEGGGGSSSGAASSQAIDEAREALQSLGEDDGHGGLGVNSTNPNIEYALRESSSTHALNFSNIPAPGLNEFPRAVFTLPHLREIRILDLSNQKQLTQDPNSSIPSQISLLKALEVLKLANMGWKSFPLVICSLTSIKELDLQANALTDLPANIAAFTSLTALNLSQNHFTTLPEMVFQFTRSLRKLYVAHNRLTSLPQHFCRDFAPLLEQFDVASNKLTSLPDGFRWMSPRFELLNIENNQLQSLPLELGLLSGLRTLLVNGNPQKTITHAILSKGTPAIVQSLKNKIPVDSPLLNDAARPRPQTPEDPHAIQVDTSQREQYASSLRQPSRGNPPSRSSAAYPSSSAAQSQQRSQRGYDDEYDQRDSYGRSNSQQPAPSASRGPKGGSSTGSGSSFADAYARVGSGLDDDLEYDDYDRQRTYSRQPPPQQQQQQQRRAAAPEYDDRYRDDYPPSSYSHDRDRGYQSQQSAPQRNDPRGGSYDRDREYYDDRRGAAPAASSQYAPSRSSFGAPPPQASSSSYSNAPPASSSSSSSSASLQSEMSQLTQQINKLTQELENNLSLNSTSKMKMRKDLASMKAELNRKQAQLQRY